MADLLKTGLAWLTEQLADSASQSVVYRRGGVEATVRATFGSKLLKTVGLDGGLQMEWTDLDFCIPSADLVLNGVTIEPKRGDEVRVSRADGVVETFEVHDFGGGPAWRWADPHRSMVRVHCKLIGSERIT
jgi:hypothetical protein